MMDVNAKYKRWGWGAIIGLVAVILVAGLVVAATLSSNPKPSDEAVLVDNPEDGVVIGDTKGSDASDNTEKNENKKEDAKENKNSGAASNKNTNKDVNKNTDNAQNNAAANTNNGAQNSAVANDQMPKTGPENVLLSFFLIAVAVSLFAYNYQMIEACARK